MRLAFFVILISSNLGSILITSFAILFAWSHVHNRDSASVEQHLLRLLQQDPKEQEECCSCLPEEDILEQCQKECADGDPCTVGGATLLEGNECVCQEEEEIAVAENEICCQDFGTVIPNGGCCPFEDEKSLCCGLTLDECVALIEPCQDDGNAANPCCSCPYGTMCVGDDNECIDVTTENSFSTLQYEIDRQATIDEDGNSLIFILLNDGTAEDVYSLVYYIPGKIFVQQQIQNDRYLISDLESRRTLVIEASEIILVTANIPEVEFHVQDRRGLQSQEQCRQNQYREDFCNFGYTDLQSQMINLPAPSKFSGYDQWSGQVAKETVRNELIGKVTKGASGVVSAAEALVKMIVLGPALGYLRDTMCQPTASDERKERLASPCCQGAQRDSSGQCCPDEKCGAGGNCCDSANEYCTEACGCIPYGKQCCPDGTPVGDNECCPDEPLCFKGQMGCCPFEGKYCAKECGCVLGDKLCCSDGSEAPRSQGCPCEVLGGTYCPNEDDECVGQQCVSPTPGPTPTPPLPECEGDEDCEDGAKRCGDRGYSIRNQGTYKCGPCRTGSSSICKRNDCGTSTSISVLNSEICKNGVSYTEIICPLSFGFCFIAGCPIAEVALCANDPRLG
mmetsp:Transcript_13221/g.20145  ORF Transcript_13221/g.20145 Transcript_13221/m.20145 type:complete len:622 (+) Transcript_13221:90-1955(+)|eukprot:CAMPEP_0178938174 /NCGR_PEP_ID=MMETSP0786-20121207/26184_1 /TAXON_ID=186022 /ORGANISM="Thalassionema frauenfeldii, Strain CCMP 1798" /LENGTH=621 /DNA_ID=CAMNT_0020616863 /DNA_START=72 /DNA_END=1937 /DNA_ORIENTATION=-